MDVIAVQQSGPGFLVWLVAGGAILLLLVPSWLLLARSKFVNGESVDRPTRVPQLYGYTVCLVTLITALVSVHELVDAAMALSNPLMHASSQFGGSFEPSLASFEAYRATHARSRMGPGGPAYGPLPTEEELRRQYDGLRAERIATVTFRSRRELVTNGTMLVIAVTLFALHWRWLRGQRPIARAAAGDTPGAAAGGSS